MADASLALKTPDDTGWRERFAFGQRLKELRGDRTLEDLAAACDTTRQHLGRIERGINSPSFDIIVRLAVALDVEPKDLFAEPEAVAS